MTAVLTIAAVSLAAYFIGNISPSTILARRRNIDIKSAGSGNAGTTNALRLMGKKAALITLVVDICKGVVAVLIGYFFAGQMGAMCCALCVFLGHVWPIVYKFKGGKGVATAFGALLAINPLMALIDLGIVVICVLITKRMSVGSIVGSIMFPVLAIFMEPEFVWIAILMAIILLIGHRSNIKRLLHGEEPVMGIFKDKSKDK